MIITRLYRTPGLSTVEQQKALATARSLGLEIDSLTTEHCFYVASDDELDIRQEEILRWLLAETFEPDGFGGKSFLGSDGGEIFEVGPRMSFSTAWSTNAVSVCHACGLDTIRRIERSRRLFLPVPTMTDDQRRSFLASIHDRMTECPYPEPLTSFEVGVEPRPVTDIPVLEHGRAALEKINAELGLAFDDWDLATYTELFRDRIRRNPTDVECFDIAQSNSEHSRHWFFKGKLILDGVEKPDDLIAMIQGPLKANRNNSVIAFNDNSSSIRGVETTALTPSEPGRPSPMAETVVDQDVIFTAETHNFPSGVAPFPGAETGTGGRIRDVHATGRGSDYTAGTTGYCVGNLQVPDDPQPWEDPGFAYPDNLASPLEIEIEASNGASDYGNKFGEPVVQGFTRSFGLRLPSGERREWIKPIMFSGGIGKMDHQHVSKGAPEIGMWVVKLGGPAYRIGMGGGAASSMVQGENVAELDFNAVQRGDAEMEQKVNRVIRACCELGAKTTPSSRSTTRAPAAIAMSSRRSSSPRGRESRFVPSPSATRPSRCSKSGAPNTRRTTRCCSSPSTAISSRPCATARRSRPLLSAGSPATAGSCSTTSGTARPPSISSSPMSSATCRRRALPSTARRRSSSP